MQSLDATVGELVGAKDRWARLPIATKIDYLDRLRPTVLAAAEDWVAAAVKAKGISPDSAAGGRGVAVRALRGPGLDRRGHRDPARSRRG